MSISTLTLYMYIVYLNILNLAQIDIVNTRLHKNIIIYMSSSLEADLLCCPPASADNPLDLWSKQNTINHVTSRYCYITNCDVLLDKSGNLDCLVGLDPADPLLHQVATLHVQVQHSIIRLHLSKKSGFKIMSWIR